MKPFQYLRWLLLVPLAVILASCNPLPEVADNRVRFGDGTSADVVVRFYSWNSIQMPRPDTRENGFLPLLNREGVVRELARPGLGRNLAVVVLGYLYSADQEAQVFQDWKTLLGEHGFRRVVLLRAGQKDQIDGLIIVRDSGIAAADAQQR